MDRLKKAIKRDYLPRWQLYMFLALPLAYIVIFAYIPMGGIQIAFREYNLLGGISGSPWVGLSNFQKFFSAHNFWSILYNTLYLAVYGMVAAFPLPIILALLINAFPGRRYKKVVQTVTYMPHFISVVVIAGMIIQLLNPRTGAAGAIYMAFTGTLMPDILGRPNAFPHLYVWSGIWQSLGWSSIVYLAALSAVDSGLHEAAEIDGASRLKRIWHIDLPCIKPTIIILMILGAGSIMNVGFEKVYLMQNRLNLSTSEVISTYVYKVAMTTGIGDFSLATAVGFFNAVINFIVLLSVNLIAGKVGGVKLW